MPLPTEQQLAAKLLFWRYSEGLALRPAAERVGISFNTYFRAEQGRYVRSDTYRRIYDFLESHAPTLH